MKLKILLGAIAFIVLLLTIAVFIVYNTHKKMADTPIIGFDIMKLSRDSVANQPSKALIDNILTIVKEDFPGTTHIAISTPEDSTVDFVSHGTKPSPLSAEAFIDMQLDEIHAAGYGAILRDFPSSLQNAYNFPVAQKTSDEWVAYNKAFLETHAAHIKSGDVIALWYELDWWQRDFGTSINDTGNLEADTNTFIIKNSEMVAAFEKEHNITLRCITTYSDVPLNYWTDPVAQAQGNVIAFDHYRPNTQNVSLNLTSAQIIEQQISDYNTAYNNYSGKYRIYVQEWGDNRSSPDGSDGGIQTTDPGFTGEMADQVFFPLIKSGILEGVDFWDLFDTPKEGILTISGDTATLNPKGQALSTVFKKWFGAGATPTPPTPTPPIQPTPPTTSDAVSSFVIVDTDTGKPITGEVDLAKVKNINVEAITTPATVGSVIFDLDTTKNYHTESFAPYYIAGKDSNDNPNSWTPAIGVHTVTATPFDQAHGAGNKGKGLNLQFTVIDSSVATVPPTPTPPIATPPIPAFSVPVSGTLVSDGKGGITLTLKS